MAHRLWPRAVVLVVSGCCGAALAVLELLRDDITPLTSDPTTTADLEPWTGLFSTLAVLGWALSAGVCVLAAAVLNGRRGGGGGSFFLATAGLLTYLALDDAYLLHEYIAPEVLGVPQPVVLALIAGAALLWATRFRHELAGSDLILLAVAAAALSGSVVTDTLGGYRLIVVEEWLKLSGIAAVAAWCLTTAAAALDDPCKTLRA
jgi:hypothetical protein